MQVSCYLIARIFKVEMILEENMDALLKIVERFNSRPLFLSFLDYHYASFSKKTPH